MEASERLPWRIGCLIRRTLPGDGPAAMVNLTDEGDRWCWSLTKKGLFDPLFGGHAPSPRVALMRVTDDLELFEDAFEVQFGPWETIRLWAYQHREKVWAEAGWEPYDHEYFPWGEDRGPCRWSVQRYVGEKQVLGAGECTSPQLGRHATDAAWRRHLDDRRAA